MSKTGYEKSMQRIQEIIEKLESSELPLEEAMKLFEEGTKLTAECYETLDKAEQKLRDIAELEIDSGEEEE